MPANGSRAGDHLDAGRQVDQLLEIPAVQRELPHLRLIHERTDGGIRRLHLGDLPFDGDGLLGLSNRQREIDDVLATDGERDALVNQGGKSSFEACTSYSPTPRSGTRKRPWPSDVVD